MESPRADRTGSRALARVVALALLSLIASFALTVGADPCSGEPACDERPCHILCTDGCTTTPVPALHVNAAPRLALESAPLALEPLPPPVPDLDSVYRPPRAVA